MGSSSIWYRICNRMYQLCDGLVRCSRCRTMRMCMLGTSDGTTGKKDLHHRHNTHQHMDKQSQSIAYVWYYHRQYRWYQLQCMSYTYSHKQHTQPHYCRSTHPHNGTACCSIDPHIWQMTVYDGYLYYHNSCSLLPLLSMSYRNSHMLYTLWYLRPKPAYSGIRICLLLCLWSVWRMGRLCMEMGYYTYCMLYGKPGTRMMHPGRTHQCTGIYPCLRQMYVVTHYCMSNRS